MFKNRMRGGRLAASVCKGLSEFNGKRAAAAVLKAFGSAGAAFLYCSPYYPFPDDFVWGPEKASDEETREGDELP